MTEPPSAVAWRQALESCGADSELRDVLQPAHEVFADLDREDLSLVARGLIRVREQSHQESRTFGYSLSARELLGSSKVLDRLPQAVRRALGVSELASTPRYVVTAAPASPKAVLLIENTTSFETAVRAGLAEDVALIAAYGYGLNLLSDSVAGWALVESVSSGRCEVLRRSGDGYSLERLLQHQRLFFWGDLDREGLRIAIALRAMLPQIVPSALYKPMCDLVRCRASSHPYAVVCGKANQQPWQGSDDAILDRLASTCSTRAVDQEAIDVQDHIHLARRSLELDDFAPGVGA